MTAVEKKPRRCRRSADGLRRTRRRGSRRLSARQPDLVVADVGPIVTAYAARLSTSEMPKLFVHLIQEDSGAEIGRALKEWHAAL